MLDTSAFNALLSGTIGWNCLRGRHLIATGVQEAEIANTPDDMRRSELQAAFEKAGTEWTPASQFVFDMAGAGWDEGSRV